MKSFALSQVIVVLAICVMMSTASGIVNSLIEGFFGDFSERIFINGDSLFMGYDCQYSSVPRFEGLGIKFDGRFSCPDLATFNGRGQASSRSSSIERATRDFAKKSLDEGFFTREELAIWL